MKIQKIGLCLSFLFLYPRLCCSSGVIWEEKKKRFKAFNMKTCTILEMAYQRYCNAIELGKNVQGRFILENKMDVRYFSDKPSSEKS